MVGAGNRAEMTVLATARLEIFHLAAALAVSDGDEAMLAATRLRWALTVAEALAAKHGEDEALELQRVRAQAARWLTAAPSDTACDARTVQRMMARLRVKRAIGEPLVDASNAALEGLDLDGLPVSACLRRSRLTGITARGARLDDLDASSACLGACQLFRASAVSAIFDSILIEDSDLSQSTLADATLRRATFARCSLLAADMTDAELDSAVFIDCDLAGANLDVGLRPLCPPLEGARFVRCDLRETSWHGRAMEGARFLDCKMYGMQGLCPSDGIEIIRPDLSPGGTGAHGETYRDVFANWRCAALLAAAPRRSRSHSN